MISEDQSIEYAIAQLQLLGKRHPLKGPDLVDAKRCMGILREAGYTNQDISVLTKGMWSESTIKLYSRSTEVRDSTMKQASLNLLSDLISSGLSLSDVQSVLSLKRSLDLSRLTIENVSFLLNEAARIGLDIQPLVQLLDDLRKSVPQASLEDLANSLAYRDELVRLGIVTPDLEHIVKAARTYGNANQVLQSLNTYGRVRSMEETVAKLSSKRDELNAKVNGLQSSVKDLENRKAALGQSLVEYDQLRSEGFDRLFFATLRKTCEIHGHQPKSILDAVNTYEKLVDILVGIEDIQERKKEEEAKLDTTRREYVRLQKVMDMSNTLLFDLQYSISDIEELHELTRKYGRPGGVYYAVNRYGDLTRIDEQVQSLLKKRAELESNIKELNIQLGALRGHADSIKESTRSSLQPLSAELSKMVQNGFEKITSVYTQQYADLRKESEEYAKRLADAKIYKEELNLARFVNAMIKYPTEAKNLPLDTPILLLDAVEKYCWAKGINPKLSLREASITDNPVYPTDLVGLLTLINAAKTALLRGYERVAN